MKKAVILTLAIIMLSSYASALISIDAPAKNIYNIGDKFPITGTVQEPAPFSGFVRFMVKCSQNEFPLQLVPASLSANELKTLKDIGAPQMTISASMGGQCSIAASLVSGNGTLSSAESAQFEITKNLDATFSVEEPRVQTGSPLKITGTVFRKDGTGIEGVAELYFKTLGQKYLIDTAEIHKGLLEYTYQTKSNAPGAYMIDVISRDMFGNEVTVNDAASFFLSNKLDVRILADKPFALPGETIKITGNVKTIIGKAPEGASADIMLDTTRIPVTLKDGSFDVEFKLPANIKSGKHEIIATARDTLGNSGNDGTKIEITPVATTLTAALDKKSYQPGETLGITAYLYDQGNDAINTIAAITITAPNGKAAFSTDIETNKLEKFQTPEFAMPGKWKINANIKTLSSDVEFEIAEMKQLEATIDGENLLISNTGNVKHTKRVVATLRNGVDAYKAYSSENIMPNKTLIIELNKYAPNGPYIAEVELPQKTVQLSVNIINGKRQINLNIFFAFLVALLVFILLYNALVKLAPVHKYQKESKFKPKMRGIRARHDDDLGYKSETKDDEMQDFRNRILKDIKKTEEKISMPLKKRGEFGGRNSGEGSGFANMFG